MTPHIGHTVSISHDNGEKDEHTSATNTYVFELERQQFVTAVEVERCEARAGYACLIREHFESRPLCQLAFLQSHYLTSSSTSGRVIRSQK